MKVSRRLIVEKLEENKVIDDLIVDPFINITRKL